MAFSIFGIFAVLLEFIRPFLPLTLTVVIIDLVLLAASLRRNGLSVTLQALKSALPVGTVTFIAGLLLVPWITGASHGNLAGLLDWLSLVGASLGLGVLVLLVVWPPLALLRRSIA
jgi:hypothetical protein